MNFFLWIRVQIQSERCQLTHNNRAIIAPVGISFLTGLHCMPLIYRVCHFVTWFVLLKRYSFKITVSIWTLLLRLFRDCFLRVDMIIVVLKHSCCDPLWKERGSWAPKAPEALLPTSQRQTSGQKAERKKLWWQSYHQSPGSNYKGLQN